MRDSIKIKQCFVLKVLVLFSNLIKPGQPIKMHSNILNDPSGTCLSDWCKSSIDS